MIDTYHIQISRADNGFIVATNSDVPGQKQKRLVGLTPDEIKTHVIKIMDEDAFMEAPKVEEPTTTTGPTPTLVTTPRRHG